MPTKQQKRQIIGRLLIPVFLIIASICYHPILNFFGLSAESGSSMEETGGENLVISYIDVGQGDATWISKGGFHMLIDAGKREKGEVLVDYLKQEGTDTIDVLVGTHPDSDHIGGLGDVLEEFPTDTVYMPESRKQTKTYLDLEKTMDKAGLDPVMPEIGKEYRFDDNVVIRFLSPSRNYDDANDNSLVVQLLYGKTKFLFMGDAEEKAEKDILSSGYDLTCDVLKVGHHGSYTATCEAFLRAADPVYGIISCGKDNAYGHPHAEVLSRLEDEDVQVYRTDTMGTVCAVSDGREVKIRTKDR